MSRRFGLTREGGPVHHHWEAVEGRLPHRHR